MSELGSSPTALAWPQKMPGLPVPCLQHSRVTPRPPPQSVLLLHHKTAWDCKSRGQCWTLVHLPLTGLSPRFFLCIINSCRAGVWGSVPMYFLGLGSSACNTVPKSCVLQLNLWSSVLAVFTVVMIVVMLICILEHKTESHISHFPHYCSSEIWGMFAI